MTHSTREELNVAARVHGWKPPMRQSDFTIWCFQQLADLEPPPGMIGGALPDHINIEAKNRGWHAPFTASDFSVWCVQRLLGLEADGLAGPHTERAMMKLITTKDRFANGIADADTLSTMFWYLKPELPSKTKAAAP